MCSWGKKQQWKSGLEFTKQNFLKLFGRSVQCSASTYLEATPKDDVRAYKDELAKRKGYPLHDGLGHRWPMRMLIPLGEEDRLEKIYEHMQLKGMDTMDDYYVTMDQNPERMSLMKGMIPALLRKGQIWSFKHHRKLTPLEHCRAVGLEVDDVVCGLSERECKSIAGNAMHRGAIAAVLLFVPCCTEYMAEAPAA